MKDNPFSLSFGKEPKSLISSSSQFNEIKNNFISSNSVSNTYLITGVRGAGKTVLLTRLAKYFMKDEDWIVVELNPEIEMFEYLASSIYEQINSKFSLLKKDFSFSFSGLTFSISGEKPVSNVITLLEKMFEIISKKRKRVLICIDDVSNNSNVKAFVQQFQIFLRKDYPLYLLMTGLFENVRNLQNEKTLTFLYRALQVNVGALSLIDISNSFLKILDVEKEEAIKMAKLTNGYAFAYQVLGYILFEKKEKTLNKKIIAEFDNYLREYVYEKIYYDLPETEKLFVLALASTTGEISKVMEELNMNKQNISQYRDKLLKKGIIVKTGWGKIAFTLPRLKEYLLIQKEFN